MRNILNYTLMLFFMFLIDISWCRPASIFGQEICSPKVVDVQINLAGCIPTKVRMIGCSGFCRSVSSLNSDYGIVSNYNCCKPTRELKVSVAIRCPNEPNGYKDIELLSARECACTTCRRRFPPLRKSWSSSSWIFFFFVSFFLWRYLTSKDVFFHFLFSFFVFVFFIIVFPLLSGLLIQTITGWVVFKNGFCRKYLLVYDWILGTRYF